MHAGPASSARGRAAGEGYPRAMSSGRRGFTVRGDDRFIRESLEIEAGLARALDDPDEPFEESLRVDVAAVGARADQVAARDGSQAARDLLLREVHRQRRWLRAVELGLAGNDDADGLEQGLRGNLARVASWAVVHGLRAGVSPDQLASEVVAAGALDLGAEGRVATARLLVVCYGVQGRPDLALSLLLRTPADGSEAETLRTLLDTARRAYAEGLVGRVAELLSMTDWPADRTGLARELIGRLVTEQEPSPAELMRRVGARGRAVDTGDWAGLLSLALSDVMWLAEEESLWRALSAILKINGAAEQAALAHEVAGLLSAPAGR
jgi:hypothetical protein